ncbi:ENDOG [Cordylochernes scorpioides]|uniref:Endonuclease n=1 Tax=Cordylochernes scorpioides TaxID=51811 RepID=A0ABY6KH84_9ARAC|nr:ENDOG [Cordylochernes scorpioides]
MTLKKIIFVLLLGFGFLSPLVSARPCTGCRGQYGEERLQDKIVASYIESLELTEGTERELDDFRTVFYRSDHSYFEELQDEVLSSHIEPLELTEGTERELDDFRTVFYRSDHSYFEELQDEVLSSYIEPLELTEGIEEKFDDFNIEFYRRRRGRENNEDEEVQNFKDPIKEGILKSLPEQAQELLKYGMPGVHHISLMGDDLVIGYDTALRVPRWVLEHLTPDSLSGGHFKRKGSDFFEDKSIHPYFRSTTQDYKGSGFDRGHMAAAGNHKKFSRDYKDTFILSNMAPQVGEDFNRGIWNNLEIYVRDKFVTKYDETFVLTGTLFLPRMNILQMNIV